MLGIANMRATRAGMPLVSELMCSASFGQVSEIPLAMAPALDPRVRAFFEKIVEGIVAEAQKPAVRDPQESSLTTERDVSEVERLFEIIGSPAVKGVVVRKSERDVGE
jgi:hypothetical protein